MPFGTSETTYLTMTRSREGCGTESVCEVAVFAVVDVQVSGRC